MPEFFHYSEPELLRVVEDIYADQAIADLYDLELSLHVSETVSEETVLWATHAIQEHDEEAFRHKAMVLADMGWEIQRRMCASGFSEKQARYEWIQWLRTYSKLANAELEDRIDDSSR